jgi:hypothetical protein
MLAGRQKQIHDARDTSWRRRGGGGNRAVNGAYMAIRPHAPLAEIRCAQIL